MNLYIVAIVVLSILVVFLFFKWVCANGYIQFWHMMYREEQRHSESLYKHVKRLEDRCMFTSRPRDNMQSLVDSLGTTRPKHEQGDGKALAEDPAPYYALDMMAKSQPKEEPHD